MTVAVPDTARCLHCGYALRGLPEAVCPECGHGFDPERPETFRDPAQTRLLRPPSAGYVAWLWVVTTAFVVACWARVGLHKWLFGRNMLGELAVAVLVAASLAEVLIRKVRAWWCRRTQQEDRLVLLRAARGRLRSVGVALVLMYASLLFPDWPLALRFYVAYPWLAAEADRYLADPNTDIGPRWVGPLHVEYIWGRGQGFVWFQTERRERVGLVRVDTCPVLDARGFERLAPRWYIGWW